MAGNQEYIRRSKFRSFYSARTIFLDFSLFSRGQRAGNLLKGFVLRDATLSGYTGVEESQIGLVCHGQEVLQMALVAARVSEQPCYLRGRVQGSPQPCIPTATHGQGLAQGPFGEHP